MRHTFLLAVVFACFAVSTRGETKPATILYLVLFLISEIAIVTSAMRPWSTADFSRTRIGSGLKFLPKTDPKHIQLLGTFTGGKGTINYNDWSDALYVSSASDPKMRIEHWSSLSPAINTAPRGTVVPYGAPSQYGQLRQVFESIPIPVNATWWGTRNTDRKVAVVNKDPIVFRNVTYPSYSLVIGIHRFARVDDRKTIVCTNLEYNDILGSGLTRGAIASGISMYYGHDRAWEIDRAVAGDMDAFAHVVRLGVNNGKLKRNQTASWPARTVDSDQNTKYNPNGLGLYGDHFSLPANFDPETALLNGVRLTNVQKALCYQMRNFGGIVLIRAGPEAYNVSGPIILTLEGSNALNKTAAAEMAKVWDGLIVSNLLIAINYHDVGTLNSDRAPMDPSRIAGGGVRRVIMTAPPAPSTQKPTSNPPSTTIKTITTPPLTTTIKPTVPPTTASVPTRSDYVGCFIDQSSPRAMTGLTTASSFTNSTTMTIPLCQKYCGLRGYAYSGLQNGRQCWCSQVTGVRASNDAECATKCNGNTSTICGGSYRNSVYKSAAGFVGCYNDSKPTRDFAHQALNSPNVTVPLCLGLCKTKGYVFAGLQYAHECWCSNTYGRYGTSSFSDCNFECEGSPVSREGATTSSRNHFAPGAVVGIVIAGLMLAVVLFVIAAVLLHHHRKAALANAHEQLLPRNKF